jgi:hypothetical protein
VHHRTSLVGLLALACGSSAGESATNDAAAAPTEDARAPAGGSPAPSGDAAPTGGAQPGGEVASPDAAVPSGGATPTVPPTAPPSCAPPPAPPLRRLTHVEYRNALSDLFPGLDTAALRLPADAYAGDYDSNLAGLEVSANLVLDQHENARVVGRFAAAQRTTLWPCTEVEPADCLRSTLATLGRRVWRRPLSSAELDPLVALHDAGPTRNDLDAAFELGVQVLVESPDFLYRTEVGVDGRDADLEAFDRATRIAFLLWASTPDDALLDAAEHGALSTQGEVEAEVDRMLADPRVRRGVLRFMDQWLELGALDTVGKLPEDRFDALRPSLAEGVRRFVWSLFERGGTQRDLLASSHTWVDRELAAIFGVEPPEGDAWVEVALEPTERAGVLTHPAFLAATGYPGYPSPVLRGVFVLERMLCLPPDPPPPGVAQAPPALEENGRPLTNREGYERVTTQAGEVCQGCHLMINPLGFAFEAYDTVGRYRTMDAGQPVDTSGNSVGFAFTSGVDLAKQLAESERVSDCLTRHFLEYALSDAPLAKDPCLQRDVLAAFEASGRRLPTLLRALVLHPAFLRLAPEGRQ